MDRNEITGIAGAEFSRMMSEKPQEPELLRRPCPGDEIDRMAQQLVRRMMESGVIDPL